MSLRTALFLIVSAIATFSIQCKTDSTDKVAVSTEIEKPAEKKSKKKSEAKATFETVDDAKPLTFEHYKALLPKYTRTVFCETVYTCPKKQMPLALYEVAQFTDKDDCFTNYSGWGNNNIEGKFRATKAGRLKFDADQAKACLKSIQALANTRERIHDTPTFGLVDCDNVHIPQQKEGKPCHELDECTLDSYCQQDRPGAPGICERNDGRNRLKFEGGNCEHDPCANGLICDVKPGDELLTCMKFRHLKAEESCGLNPTACASGLTCSTTMYQCEPLKKLAKSGEPCDVDTAGCELGLTCRDYVQDFTASTMIGTCGAVKNKNEPCHLTSECKAGLSCDDSRCIADS